MWEIFRQVLLALLGLSAGFAAAAGLFSFIIGLGVVGILPPAASAMLHNLSTLAVSLHSMSALPLPKAE